MRLRSHRQIGPSSHAELADFPEELGALVFSMVAAESLEDLASCRLVNSDWHRHSSPFLVTTAVVAERPQALKKLRELLRHPYFRQHVRTLIWDASVYEREIATSYPLYRSIFHDSPHLTKYAIVSHTDDASTPHASRFTRREVESAITSGGMRGDGELPLDFLLKHEMRDRTHPSPRIPESLVVDRPRDCDTLENGDKMYYEGCHKGFEDYVRGWRRQEALIVKGGDKRQPFLAATKAFPRLQHVAFSDYRALRLAGESYVQLCTRLFGNTVCPQPPEFKGLNEAVRDFLETLKAANHGGPWKSVSICRHPFETHAFDQVSHRQALAHATHLDLQLAFQQAVEVLRLPLVYGAGVGEPPRRALDNFHSSKLLELELGGSYNFSKAHLGSRQKYDAFYESRWGPAPHLVFRQLLVPARCNFERLRSLTLRGFIFDTAALKDLLITYASTLQFLHILDCWCIDPHKDFRHMIRRWVRPALRLSGVEVYGLRFLRPGKEKQGQPHSPRTPPLPFPLDSPAFAADDAVEKMVNKEEEDDGDDWYTPEYSETMRTRRAIDLESCKTKKREKEFPKHNFRSWPCERPQVEADFLLRRPNSVVRKVEAAPTQEVAENWRNVKRWSGE